MLLESIRKEIDYESCMESLLNLLFTRLTRLYHKRYSVKGEYDEREHALIGEILAYINKHPITVSLKELSRIFGYSERHLSRMIRQYTGRNYVEIIQHLKLEQARNDLAMSNMPVSEIIEHAGFHSPSYFYRIFREHYLMSPSEYRKNTMLSRNGD